MTRVEEIPIDKIIIPEERARATFTQEQHDELVASIKNYGFTIPILVQDNKDGTYTLIDGEHRIQVAKELGYTKVPATIVEADTKKATMLNILANTARGTQNPIDVARALKRAYEAGATIEELAAATGHTTDWVEFYLLLNKLPEVYQEALRTGRLKVGHVRECLRLPTPQECAACLDNCINLEWTVSTARYYVNQRLAEIAYLQAKGESLEDITPPTQEEAEHIVTTTICPHCRRAVNRDEMTTLYMCNDCMTLFRYIITQFGDPKKAMQIIYEAVTFYNEYKAKVESRIRSGREEYHYYGSPTPTPQYQEPPPIASSSPTVESEITPRVKESSTKRAGSKSVVEKAPQTDVDERIKNLEERISILEDVITRQYQRLLSILERRAMEQ